MKKSDIINIIREEVNNILFEISINDIKDRILNVLSIDSVQKYKVDEYTYEEIPYVIFSQYGILPIHLKQYDMSTDLTTYALGIRLNPIKKTVDVFLQKKGILNF